MRKIDKFLPFLLLEKGENITGNSVPMKAIISDERSQSNFNDDKFIRTIESIKTGDKIEYQGNKWLVINETVESQTSYKGKIRRFNYITNIVIDNKLEVMDSIYISYKNKIDDIKGFPLSDDAMQVMISETITTKKIKIGDRFIKFGKAWRVLGRDYTKKGIITLTVESNLIDNMIDDVINEIANVTSISEYSITIKNGLSVSLSSTQTLKLAVEIKKNGLIVSDAVPKYESLDTLIATVGVNGEISGVSVGNTYIKVSYSNISIDVNVGIITSDVINTSMNIIGIDEIRNGKNSTYTCEILENGLPILKPFTWSITDDMGNVTTLATISVLDGVCTVTAIKENKQGNIILIAKADDLSVTSNKIIYIKSLLSP